MKKHLLLMSCAFGALVLSGQGAWAAAPATENSGTIISEIVVTAQRREENLQSAPVAVSAFSGETLKSKRLDGGQNLVLQVPNSNYTRSNFGGFNFKIRGIGTDVVGNGGTSGVSINVNELPLSANNFANSDFFDVDRVEVVRGPQGTLYGRNATGGAVDVITTKPSQTFRGYGSAEYGNFNTVKVSGAVNIPLGEAFALRVAGVRLVQDGFGVNTYLNRRVDGRDLGAIRATLSFKPSDKFDAYLMFEHYGEDDDRNRVGKQLCIHDSGTAPGGGPAPAAYAAFLTQGCLPGSLNQPAAYGVVNGNATFGGVLANLIGLNNGTDVFAGHAPQDTNLHNIESRTQPLFTSMQNLVDLHMAYHITDDLTLTSITGFNQTSGTSQEDYNRVVPTQPFHPVATGPAGPLPLLLFPNGVVKDPQNGPSNLLANFDYGSGTSKEYTEELRLTSSFKGRVNFSVGAFYSEIDTPLGNGTNYYVTNNVATAFSQLNNFIGGALAGGLINIDPNPVPNGSGHNYFDARTGGGHLKSYAGFGELYVELAPTLKLTLGGRYTSDQLYNLQYPQGLLVGTPNGGPAFPGGASGGFPTNICNNAATCLLPQRVTYNEFTGRANLDWTPTLSFTDKTLVYVSYGRGYKGGGFNTICQAQSASGCGYPLNYNPEFINAYEIGTKNTLLGGALNLNLTGFYYKYTGYQIAEFVAQSAQNVNINAKIYGVEFESVYSPVRNLTLNANIGYIHSAIDSGQSQVDTLDPTAGNPAYTVIKSAGVTSIGEPGLAQNCLAPTAAAAAYIAGGFPAAGLASLCAMSGANELGVPKDLGGKQLPNTPKVTVSAGAQYVFELSGDWKATLRGDYYWQHDSYARVFNTASDLLKSYHVVNATLTFANLGEGVDLQLYVKNAFNAQPITGIYLADPSVGLFRNVFTLDPRTYGAQITKKF